MDDYKKYFHFSHEIFINKKLSYLKKLRFILINFLLATIGVLSLIYLIITSENLLFRYLIFSSIGIMSKNFFNFFVKFLIIKLMNFLSLISTYQHFFYGEKFIHFKIRC